MSGPAVGFFGKLPSNGDFLERRVAAPFHEAWDGWLQRCLTASREQLGGRWLDCYLTSPLWRFFLSDGVAGKSSYLGVLLPSVDRVGRYFPLTVVVELPVGLAPLSVARAAAPWFVEVEELCTAVLQDGNTELERFDAALVASGARLEGVDGLQSPQPFPGAATQWHWPIRDVDQLSAALAEPLMGAAEASLRPLSLWWTTGSELVQPCVLLARALPRPDSFAALLAGGWDDGHWEGVPVLEESDGPRLDGADQSASAPMELVTVSGGATDVGTVRHENQDALLLNESNRLWAVADGMGGHRQGGVASQMVIDALNALEPTASLNATLQSMTEALTRVNADLRRGAVGFGPDGVSGSTVVALFIRGGEWGVAWAGDSRLYRWRAGELTPLTRDHSPFFQPDETAIRAPGNTEITRAVGGDDEFELDQLSDHVADGDRFLLCSDGLYDALDGASIGHIIAQGTPEEASQALIQAARAAG
ncbi:MAG TPA: type VI secretion system-associated protein TagF, partial [Steroidobacteraceae bacterium]|nr:type VI secretion system-associated protein TagF [Steroidobacteraceae bacterium]